MMLRRAREIAPAALDQQAQLGSHCGPPRRSAHSVVADLLPLALCLSAMTTRANILTRYRRLDPRCKRLLREASLALGLASFAVAVLPFRRAIAVGAVPLCGSKDDSSIRDIRWAVEGAAPRLPWRTMCIEQGIAMQRLLRRRGIDARLRYGARPDEGAAGLKAHVWLTVGDEIVIGEAEAAGYAELAMFPER